MYPFKSAFGIPGGAVRIYLDLCPGLITNCDTRSSQASQVVHQDRCDVAALAFEELPGNLLGQKVSAATLNATARMSPENLNGRNATNVKTVLAAEIVVHAAEAPLENSSLIQNHHNLGIATLPALSTRMSPQPFRTRLFQLHRPLLVHSTTRTWLRELPHQFAVLD